MTIKKFIVANTLLASAMILSACSNQTNHNSTADSKSDIEILNVSYDVARDFYKDYNPLFINYYKTINPNAHITIKQSHGSSSKQALSVKNGLQADVVTMNQGSDVQILADSGLVNKNWQQMLPNHAIPFTSTIVFIVRKNNPKAIKDWDDLAKSGTKIILANPKTSGNGRYAFLGAYGYGLLAFHQNKEKTDAFVRSLLNNVTVFENGGRAATTTFAQRELGDVLLTFENEANIIQKKFGNVDIIYPSYTINAENPVAVVESVSHKKATNSIAQAYLEHLYSDEAQELAVKYFLRPSNEQILQKHADKFPKMQTFFPNEVFGDWSDIMQTYFSEGGVYDKLVMDNQHILKSDGS